jgi:peptidoglycan hydrolase CwlO-like protein
MARNDSKQRLIAIAAVVVVALLAVNAFLLYNKYMQDKVIAQQQVEIDDAKKLEDELTNQLDKAYSEIEAFRGENEELDAMLDQREAELDEAKARIAGLIKSGKDLKRARAELNGLRSQNEAFTAEITQLRQQVEYLQGENSQLANKTQALQQDLGAQKQATVALEEEKASLAAEKQSISSQRDNLAKTVNFASVVKVQGVNVVGMKTKGNGKAVKKKYAKNIDQLKVCFKTTVNEVTRAGLEQFYVRIVNPIGETMAIEELGSGKIVNKKTGEEILYTQVKEYDYVNDETELCFNWEPNAPFQKGNYDVEIYNKGHLAGKGSFNLK